MSRFKRCDDWSGWKIGLCLLVGLACVGYGSDEPHYKQDAHLYWGLIGFGAVFAMLFKKDIVAALNKELLLSYTLTFWFAFFVYYFKGTPTQIVVLCVCLLPTAATLFVTFNKANLTTVAKIGFYAWFVCIVLELGVLRFSFAQLAVFFDNRSLPWISPIESPISGMAFLYLVANATYLYFILPIPGKTLPRQSRLYEWHYFNDILAERFDDSVLSRLSCW